MAMISAFPISAAQSETEGVCVSWGDVFLPYVKPGTQFKKISTGLFNNFGIKSDGTVVAWGLNHAGQSAVPAGLNGVVASDGGVSHSIALKSDGTVVEWGQRSGVAIPVGLKGVIAIDAGYYHNLALKNDGTVVEWGAKPEGGKIKVPPGLTGVVAISAGYAFSLALKSDGTVIAWDGHGETWWVPEEVRGVIAIAAGFSHALALKSDGTVIAWGGNPGPSSPSLVPNDLRGVVAIAAGSGHSLALRSDGTVVAWGSKDSGGTVPPGLDDVSSIAAGDGHNMATKRDGTVIAWGSNGAGQVILPWEWGQMTAIAAGTMTSSALKKDGTVVAWGSWPAPSGLNGIIAISAGVYRSLALKSDGTVVAWGSNQNWGTNVPIGLSNVIAIAAGGNHSLALKSDGTVVAWGYGGGTNTPPGLDSVIAIAAGASHSLALKKDGTVVAWGSNHAGQSEVPAGLYGVIAVSASAGGYHSLALKSDGTVVAWGSNHTDGEYSGQSAVPAGLHGVIAIAAGGNHSLALKKDGTVTAWGYNSSGQTNVPIELNGVFAIAAGWVDSLALCSENQSPRTLPASAITISSAQLNGYLDPSGLAASAYFEYGLTTAYGSQTAAGNFGTTAQNISFKVTRLLPNTTYHYRIVAANTNGTSRGNDVIFTTGVPQQLAFRGTVVDGTGKPVPQATIDARGRTGVNGNTTTGPDGRYSLNLPEGEYELTAAKPGFIADSRAVALIPGNTEQSFQLLPKFTPPLVEDNNTSVLFAPRAPGANGSYLLLFNGATFISSLSGLDRNKMTIVLTHGWLNKLDSITSHVYEGWVIKMARALELKGVRTNANILAWDWTPTAHAFAPPETDTPDQGVALGKALQTQAALRPSYSGRLHMIGHSLGTIVNGYAVDYLHGYARAGQPTATQTWATTNTHVTLFDEASLAAGTQVFTPEFYAKLLNDLVRNGGTYPNIGWKNPVPNKSAWVDNYISSFGRYYPQAVNILLQRPMEQGLTKPGVGVLIWGAAMANAHSYPPAEWYPESVQRPDTTTPGFGTSFEYSASNSTIQFPPPGLQRGTVYRQADLPADKLQLEILSVTDPAKLSCPAVTTKGVTEVLQYGPIDYATDRTVDFGKSAARYFGHVTLETAQVVTRESTTAAGWIADGLISTLDLMSRLDPTVHLATKLSPAPRKLSSEPAGIPAGVWLPIIIPSDAKLLTFNFVMEGDGGDDALVCTLAGTNLFTLPTRSIPTGVTNSSSTLDISAFAGTTNELFLGVLGGTSTNCAMRIEQIRFFGIPAVTLTINTGTTGKAVLSWPSTINGYALETTTSLTAAQWNTVTNIPSLFAGRFAVTNEAAGETRFFRLRKQN